jgi:fatty acid omega-hydroxylase
MRFIRPTFVWKLQRVLGLGYEGALSQGIQVIDTAVYDIIAQALKNRADKQHDRNSKDESSQTDIVSLFLDSHKEEDKFDPKFLRDIVMNFLIAGRDTTAQALSWFVYCLSCNPEVETKIRHEIREKLPCLIDGTTKFGNLGQVITLVYLEAAVKETLRLYPPVPYNARQAVRDTTLSDGTFLKVGTNVAVPSYSLGRMKNVWGPDAKEFKPERWIDEKTGKLITFSAFKFHMYWGQYTLTLYARRGSLYE